MSSISWDHHLVIEMLVLALAAPLLAPGTGRWWMAVAAYPLLWLPHSVGLLGFAAVHAPGAVVVMVGGSLPFLGMVLVWAACCLCLTRVHESLAAQPGEDIQRGQP